MKTQSIKVEKPSSLKSLLTGIAVAIAGIGSVVALLAFFAFVSR